MGMDYCWSGSASYPRFKKELEAVAAVLDSTSPILSRWLKEPYGDYTPEETKFIWNIIQRHPEIEEISWQIWNELKICCELDTAWYIY